MSDLWKKQKLPVSRKEAVYLALILIVFGVIVAILSGYPRTRADLPEGGASETTRPAVEIREVEKIVEVEKEVTVEELRQGLNDMGFLITGEYYFTDLVGFTSIKKFLKTEIELPFTESSYLVSYDGKVDAGVDLSGARVEKDDVKKQIVVYLPAAEIQMVDIDLDSFVLREERSGFGNHLSVQDFNRSLQELENKARENAIDRGLLERADENAKVVVSRFVCSLVDTARYSLEFVSDGSGK